MASHRFPTDEGEVAALVRQGFLVHMLLGTNIIEIDLADPEGIKQGEALLAMRQAKQDEKDRVGDPR